MKEREIGRMNLPYSFAPLFGLLEKFDLSTDDLIKRKILSKRTVDKIESGQQVMLATVAKICLGLGCDFSDVVELNYDYDPTETFDDGTQNYKPWTKKEEERLIDEYQSDFAIADIAKNLNRAPGAVSSRISRLVYSGKVKKRVSQKKKRA